MKKEYRESGQYAGRGIIACLSQETTDFSHFATLKEINMPLILFDRVCLTDQFSSVIADGAQSAQMATQHLLDNGSKRVAFIGGANHLDIVKEGSMVIWKPCAITGFRLKRN